MCARSIEATSVLRLRHRALCSLIQPAHKYPPRRQCAYIRVGAGVRSHAPAVRPTAVDVRTHTTSVFMLLLSFFSFHFFSFLFVCMLWPNLLYYALMPSCGLLPLPWPSLTHSYMHSFVRSFRSFMSFSSLSFVNSNFVLDRFFFFTSTS